MRFHTFVCVVLLAVTTPTVAQNPTEIAYFHLNRIKPGMTTQYEATRKKHWLWHKRLGDTWSCHVWQVVSGEAGAYIISSFGHTWKEVDASDQLLAGDEDPGGNVEPYLAFESEMYYRYRSDLSLATQIFSPAPKLAVTRFILKPESINDFLDGVAKIRDAIRKTDYPLAGSLRWFQLITGGENPQFLLLSDRAGWAAFEQSTEKTLDAVMEGAYGKEQGVAILRTVRGAIRSEYVETWQYRPDLSYVPQPK
jgi:hypothetical protein